MVIFECFFFLGFITDWGNFLLGFFVFFLITSRNYKIVSNLSSPVPNFFLSFLLQFLHFLLLFCFFIFLFGVFSFFVALSVPPQTLLQSRLTYTCRGACNSCSNGRLCKAGFLGTGSWSIMYNMYFISSWNIYIASARIDG